MLCLCGNVPAGWRVAPTPLSLSPRTDCMQQLPHCLTLVHATVPTALMLCCCYARAWHLPVQPPQSGRSAPPHLECHMRIRPVLLAATRLYVCDTSSDSSLRKALSMMRLGLQTHMAMQAVDNVPLPGQA